MNIKQLVGAGDKIIGFTLPFALAGIILNVLFPQWFIMNTGLIGIIGLVREPGWFQTFGLPYKSCIFRTKVLKKCCFNMEVVLKLKFPNNSIIGSALLGLGIPFWLTSVIQMLKYVPQNKLITKSPFLLILHPIYTSVVLLVIPGLTFVFDTWVGLLIGAILYIISRIFRGQEEKKLEELFREEYTTYRSKIIIPWL